MPIKLKLNQEFGKSKSVLETVHLNDVNALQFGYSFLNDIFLIESDIVESMTLARDAANIFIDAGTFHGVEYKIQIDKVVSLKHFVV